MFGFLVLAFTLLGQYRDMPVLRDIYFAKLDIANSNVTQGATVGLWSFCK